jgi:hypothetical protein
MSTRPRRSPLTPGHRGPMSRGLRRCGVSSRLQGYLATYESTGSAGHRRPVPAPLPVRHGRGTAGSGGRRQDPAALSAGAARPALSDSADAGGAAGCDPAVAGSACRLSGAAAAKRIAGRVRPAGVAGRWPAGLWRLRAWVSATVRLAAVRRPGLPGRGRPDRPRRRRRHPGGRSVEQPVQRRRALWRRPGRLR